VCYRQKYDSNPAANVEDDDWAAMLDVVQNELPGISESFHPPRTSRSSTVARTTIRAGPSKTTGATSTAERRGHRVRDSFSSGAAGLGGCIYGGDCVLVGGGAVTLTGGGGYADKRHVIRHELGHALGWAHPFDNIAGGEATRT